MFISKNTKDLGQMKKSPRVLVVSSCTGRKRHKPVDQLVKYDFENPERLRDRFDEFSEYACSADEMYIGQQHLRLMRGIALLRESGIYVDLWILSAGYGLIPGDQVIIPYECTFDSMNAKEIDEWAEHLSIPKTFRTILRRYQFGVILLGKKYLRSVQIQKEEKFPIPLVFFCADKKDIKGSNGIVFPTGIREAKDFHCGLVGLKGQVFRLLAEKINENPMIINDLVRRPEAIREILEEERNPVKTGKSATRKVKKLAEEELVPFGRSTSDICPPKLRIGKPSEYAPPQRTTASYHPRKNARMLYFIPEWNDLVDPRYDFEHDFHFSELYGLKHDAYLDDFYAHELYGSFNYDGILISKVTIEKNKKKTSYIQKLGVHRFLRCPTKFPIMGDCGAFGYVKEHEPPYETKETLDYYQRLGFDYGVSIDHMIVPGICQKTSYFKEQQGGVFKAISKNRYKQLTNDPEYRVGSSRSVSADLFDKRRVICLKKRFDEKEAERRWNITLNNGESFIRAYKKGRYGFKPIGACQGWNAETYREMFEAYQKFGYDYIALGGLVRSPTASILEILEEVGKIKRPSTKIHLFGIARLDAIPDFLRLGVASVDSASHLRRAWLGAGGNYWATPSEAYAAVRVPPVRGHNVKIKRMIEQGKGSIKDFLVFERKALKALRAYDEGRSGLEETLKEVLMYDRLIGEDRADLEKMYRRLLREKPWKKCSCPVCRDNGIEVVLFRRNNRNRRRGFHNTHVFYKEFAQQT